MDFCVTHLAALCSSSLLCDAQKIVTCLAWLLGGLIRVLQRAMRRATCGFTVIPGARPPAGTPTPTTLLLSPSPQPLQLEKLQYSDMVLCANIWSLPTPSLTCPTLLPIPPSVFCLPPPSPTFYLRLLYGSVSGVSEHLTSFDLLVFTAPLSDGE